ncbi:hypothetical protein TrispH2_010435 [Trichoplax sp. H2]|nr:hypothetical protein TrispH2_010435 [Trichoplax sp. H2]|eukprot:RDD37309.1 hypothetical protein TrispH2_010435 [Trichoplax sp. H2]
MELQKLIWILIISSLSFDNIAGIKSISASIDPRKESFNHTIRAEQELLKYIKKERANLKWLDAYNLLIAISAFRDITKEYFLENSYLSSQDVKRISEMNVAVNILFQNSLEKFSPEYRLVFSEEVSFAAVARYINGTKPSLPISGPTPANTFPSNMSEICIATTLSGSIGSASCNVTEACWNYISQPGTRMGLAVSQLYTDYFIRQLDYCGFKLVKLAGGIRRLMAVEESLCSRIYMDFKKILHNNISDINKAELLLQQIIICGGMFGYVEFVSIYPLHQVFKYQARSGCFKNSARNRRSQSVQISSSLELINSRADLASDECNLHVSTVAFASLATSLRWWSFKHIGIPHPTTAPKSNNGLVYAFVIVCLLLVVVLGAIAGFIIYPRFKKRKYDEL